MWYVIQVRTGSEERVTLSCRRLIVSKEEDVFYPTRELIKRIHGENVLTKRALFPGYVFFETENPEGLFHRLKRVQLLTKLLRVDGEFVPIYPEEEALLRKLCGKDHSVGVSEGFTDGKKVHIVSGPLTGMEGKVKKINRHKKIAVLEVFLLGEMRELVLGYEDIGLADVE